MRIAAGFYENQENRSFKIISPLGVEETDQLLTMLARLMGQQPE
jgi:hypothetical protein